MLWFQYWETIKATIHVCSLPFWSVVVMGDVERKAGLLVSKE